jgi:tRNA(adenine34) deaminase
MAISEAARRLGTWRLTDCVLVVTLEPCPMCLAACQQARIGEVIYGTADPKGGALSLGYCVHEDSRTHHRFPVSHSETDECREILRDFFRKKRTKV